MSPAQNVTQNIYLRKAEGGQNKVVGIAVENLADPGTGCKLADADRFSLSPIYGGVGVRRQTPAGRASP